MICKYFLPPYGLTFHSVDFVFKIFKSNLSIFSFAISAFGVIAKKLLPIVTKVLSYVFF